MILFDKYKAFQLNFKILYSLNIHVLKIIDILLVTSLGFVP